jgi:hypothetical protein
MLIKLDPDDESSVSRVRKWEKRWSNIRFLVFPRGEGYCDLHVFYNALAKAAEGEWLFLWNDDCRLVSQGWDQFLAGVPVKPPGLVCPRLDIGPEVPCEAFPIVSRVAIEAMDHFSLNAHNDSWVMDVFARAGRQRFESRIVLTHFAERLQDQTHAENVAASANRTWPAFQTPAMEAARILDAEIVRSLQ